MDTILTGDHADELNDDDDAVRTALPVAGVPTLVFRRRDVHHVLLHPALLHEHLLLPDWLQDLATSRVGHARLAG